MYPVCRLCLSENNTFFDIFESKGTRGWIAANLIIELLRFQVSSYDKYPHCVCSECMGKLEDFKLFKQRCETNKELLDRAYAVKDRIQPSEELDVRIFGHDGNRSELYLREEDVEISIKEESDVAGDTIKTEIVDCLNDSNVISSAGVIELTDQVSIPIKGECDGHETTLEADQTNVPHNSSEVVMESDVKIPEIDGQCENYLEVSKCIVKEEVLDIPAESEDSCAEEGELEISGDELKAPTVNNSNGIPLKMEGCSYTDNNVLGTHSSGPSSDNEGPSGVSNSSGAECSVGNGEEFTDSSSSNTKWNAYVCDFCGERFSRLKDVADHMCRQVSEKQFRCKQCNKVFHLEDSLEKHWCNIRSAKKPIMCGWCGKGFSCVSHLQRHETGHTGERPFECTVCSKSFSLKGTLKQHMVSHSGKRLFKCMKCSKTFIYMNHLRQHLIAHSGKRPFKCNECIRSFPFKGDLNKHMRTHSGERLFKCTVCRKSFCHKGDLTRHENIHTGETPFKCNECGKAFRLKYNLESHMRTHFGERPFKCSKCNKAFSCKSNLNRHMKTHTSSKEPL